MPGIRANIFHGKLLTKLAGKFFLDKILAA
jgi:hypothetical protein